MLLWAPGGRGKTALLVRWLAELPPDLDKVFVPISIRAGTNLEHVFYEALAARLGTVLEEQPTKSADAYHYRERVHTYLKRFTNAERPCLVVIDGLDEATGWDVNAAMLPRQPPAGLRVVVSARQLFKDKDDRGWLSRLGWSDAGIARSEVVRPLGRAGIADLLRRSSLTELSEDEAIVGRLYNLTDGGEPLVVKLYAEQLLEQRGLADRLRHGDLKDLKRGLAGFFDLWFADQNAIWEKKHPPVDKNAVYLVLAILACAHGALKIKDILGVAKHAGLGLFVGPAALEAVERFVIGKPGPPGDTGERNFVLTRPRLSEFLRSDEFLLTHAYVPQIQAAFLAWGASEVEAVNKPGANPGHVPRYLLVYYLQHLKQDPNTPLSRYRALAENGWRLACTEHGGGEASLVEQLDTCLDRLLEAGRADPAALQVPKTGLGGIVHVGLCLASLQSQGTSIPPNLLAEMVRQGVLGPSRALFISRFRRDGDRSAIISDMALVLNGEMLDTLQTEAATIREPLERAKAILSVARRRDPGERPALLGEAIRSAAAETSAVKVDNRLTIINNCLEAARELKDAEADAMFSMAEQIIGRDKLLPRRAPVPEDADSPPSEQSQTQGALSSQQASPAAAAVRPASPETGFSPAAFLRRFDWRFRGLSDEFADARARLATTAADAASGDDLRLALEMIFALEELHRLGPLKAIAPFLPAELLTVAIDLVFERCDLWFAELLAPLSRELDDEAMIALFARLLQEPLDYKTYTALGELISSLSDEAWRHVWPQVAGLTPSYLKVELLKLARERLDSAQLTVIVDAVAEPATGHYMEKYYRIREIGVARAKLSTDQLRRLVDACFAMESGWNLLEIIAPALDPGLLEDALSRSLETSKSWKQRLYLNALLSSLAKKSPELLDRVVDASRAAGDISEGLSLLDMVLPHLTVEKRQQAILEAQWQALAINDRPAIALALAALGEMPDLADAAARSPGSMFLAPSKSDQSSTIVLAFLALLPRIDADRARDALQLVEDRIEALDTDDRRAVATITALCPKLSRVKGARAVAAALDARNEAEVDAEGAALIGALLLFSPHLSPEQAEPLISNALSAIRDDKTNVDRRLTLAALLAEAPHVVSRTACEMIAIVEEAIKSENTRPLARSVLAAAMQLCRRFYYAELDRLRLPQPSELLKSAKSAEDEREFGTQDLVLFGLLPYLDAPLLLPRTLETRLPAAPNAPRGGADPAGVGRGRLGRHLSPSAADQWSQTRREDT